MGEQKLVFVTDLTDTQVSSEKKEIKTRYTKHGRNKTS